ncbi:10497_t:CDS:2 [Funneliformis geosporum]|uniref:15995_t:CDS:1 n=1 Tax=Funneliformis geosporum TaxID=1117311 RepID=A0A9W4SN76_9GLOM|nr:15995_t:CDS:2 [Funneliformis geosporum]CAI2175404.1 10497_t:CDS:2 [Funneliformis geosporum]
MSSDQKVETTLDVHDSKEEPTSTSLRDKFSYVLSKDFIIIVLLGQFLSFCITVTIVTSTELAVNHKAEYPTTQTFLTYIILAVVYTPFTIYKKGFNGWINIIKKRWWKYAIFSLIDVEGNYFVVKAYKYTSLLSTMLLDTWAIPCVVLLSFIFLKVRFHWSQYLAVLICLAGIAALIIGDFKTDVEMNTGSNLILGDIFCLISATCYAISNVAEEFLVRQRPFWEVVGQLGIYGTIISGIQLAILERGELIGSTWDGKIIGIIVAYSIAMFCLYTGAPILFKLASATFFNLSLLTSDFYSIIFAIFLFQSKLHHLHIVAFVGTMLGLTIYNIYPATQPKVESIKDEDEED